MVFFDAHNVWNNLPSLFNHDRVPHTDIFALNFVRVMQTCPADGGLGQFNGFELSHWSECASLSDLNFDGIERGDSRRYGPDPIFP